MQNSAVVISNLTPRLSQVSNFHQPFVNTIISAAKKNNSPSAITVAVFRGSVGVSAGLEFQANRVLQTSTTILGTLMRLPSLQ